MDRNGVVACPAVCCVVPRSENHSMLSCEDETARTLFAVYVRPEGERGTINFYTDEAQAHADVGPGMPEGVITHGDVYIEYIGDVLLYAPSDWPLIAVDQDLLIQLQFEEREIFIALTPAESAALLALEGSSVTIEQTEPVPTEVPDLVEAPQGVSGTEPCVVWLADGSLVIFEQGADTGGRELSTVLDRPDFGDEAGSDVAVVALLDEGWVPLLDDEYTWREVDDAWVINVQRRIADSNECFFARYTSDDRTVVVTRLASDTDDEEEHLQLVGSDVDLDFIDLGRALVAAGWRIDSESKVAAELASRPDLRESPGWYPDDEEGVTPRSAETPTEWFCVVMRTPRS